jgi:hypothetical protein
VLYYKNHNIKQWLSKHHDDYIIIKFRNDCKPGIKKLLKQLPKDKKVLLVTRDIEYLKDPNKLNHQMCIENVILYFIKEWVPFFEKNELDVFKMLFDYVDCFDCLEDLKLAVDNKVNRKYSNLFDGKKVIGGHFFEQDFEQINIDYKQKFLGIYRNYKLYQLFGSKIATCSKSFCNF